MENGRKFDIPLTSGLDVKSSDMLVSVQQPTFLHNRQRFQGHVLPNSLRYEKNGYAAGNDVYTFDANEGEILAENDPNYKLVKYSLNDNPGYVFKLRYADQVTDIATIYFNDTMQVDGTCLPVDSTSAFSSITADGDPDNMLLTNVTATLKNGTVYTFTISTESGKPVLVTQDPDISIVNVDSNGVTTIQINDSNGSVYETIDGIIAPSSLYNASEVHPEAPYKMADALTAKVDGGTYYDIGDWQVNLSTSRVVRTPSGFSSASVTPRLANGGRIITATRNNTEVSTTTQMPLNWDNMKYSPAGVRTDSDIDDAFMKISKKFALNDIMPIRLLATYSTSITTPVQGYKGMKIPVYTAIDAYEVFAMSASTEFNSIDSVRIGRDEILPWFFDNTCTVDGASYSNLRFNIIGVGSAYNINSTVKSHYLVKGNSRYNTGRYCLSSTSMAGILTHKVTVSFTVTTAGSFSGIPNGTYTVSGYCTVPPVNNSSIKIEIYKPRAGAGDIAQRLTVTCVVSVNAITDTYTTAQQQADTDNDWYTLYTSKILPFASFFFNAQSISEYGYNISIVSGHCCNYSISNNVLQLSLPSKCGYGAGDILCTVIQNGMQYSKFSYVMIIKREITHTFNLVWAYTRYTRDPENLYKVAESVILKSDHTESDTLWAGYAKGATTSSIDGYSYINNNADINAITLNGNTLTVNLNYIYSCSPLEQLYASLSGVFKSVLLSIDSYAFDRTQLTPPGDNLTTYDFNKYLPDIDTLWDTRTEIDYGALSDALPFIYFFKSRDYISNVRDERFNVLGCTISIKNWIAPNGATSAQDCLADISAYESNHDYLRHYLSNYMSGATLSTLANSDTLYANSLVSADNGGTLLFNDAKLTFNDGTNLGIFVYQKVTPFTVDDSNDIYIKGIQDTAATTDVSTKPTTIKAVMSTIVSDGTSSVIDWVAFNTNNNLPFIQVTFIKNVLVYTMSVVPPYGHTSGSYSYNNGTHIIQVDNYEITVDQASNKVTVDGTNVANFSISVPVKQEWPTDTVSNLPDIRDYYGYTFGVRLAVFLKWLLSVVPNGPFNKLAATNFSEQYTNDMQLLTFTSDNTQLSFDLLKFNNQIPLMHIYAANVTAPDSTTSAKRIADIVTKDELQFIKQQWNSTFEVEDFWWLDSDHILELNKFNLVVKEKQYTGGKQDIDDWDGNVWKEVSDLTFDRPYLLNSSVEHFMCSSSNNEDAPVYFITLQKNNLHSVSISVYDVMHYETVQLTPTKSIHTPVLLKQFKVNFRQIGLGNYLSDSTQTTDSVTINSYTSIIASDFLAEADFSATSMPGGVLLLGMHYDNNLLQWTFKLDVTGAGIIDYIIGYGYVGIDGSLTGGQFPAAYNNGTEDILLFDVDQHGFTGKVEELNKLNTEDTDITQTQSLYTFTEGIYGNESQQWYIYKKLTGIVSHLLYTDNTWKVEVLPISCNYDITYQSPSFITRRAGDAVLQDGVPSPLKRKPIKSMLPGDILESDNTFTQIVSKLTDTEFVFYNPKITTVNYLQQTLGQYAYVHYNSTITGHQKTQNTNNNLDDVELQLDQKETGETNYVTHGPNPVASDDFSFDIQRVAQEQDVGINPWSEFIYALGLLSISALDYSVEQLTVNGRQNQSAIFDMGKKYGQAFLKNMDSLSSTNFTIQSITPTLKSEVTAVKTLDMFYSTSSNQQVHAGAGYVNHNFVAQCVAQSVTSLQLESQQMGIMLPMKFLSLWYMQLAIWGLDIAEDGLEKGLNISKDTQAFAVGTGGNGIGVAAAIGLLAGYVATKTANSVMKAAYYLISEFMDALSAKQMQSNIMAKQSRHEYNIEGKHRYGSKSESFMWPCIVHSTERTFNDETVEAVYDDKTWKLSLYPFMDKPQNGLYKGKDMLEGTDTLPTPNCNTIQPSTDVNESCIGDVHYCIAACKGVVPDESNLKSLPRNMAYVVGTDTFLPNSNFKNENIGESEPIFTIPPLQDYLISSDWQIMQACTAGETVWVACKDTKLIDGKPSNMVIHGDKFCGIASSYTAIEVRRGVDIDYVRPWPVTPTALAFNISGWNVAYNEKMYHGFDGVSYRIDKWLGASGMNKEYLNLQYAYQKNDRFKRSNILRPNRFMGNFKSEPDMTLDVKDSIVVQIVRPSEAENFIPNVEGENRDVARYAIPMFSEFVNTLPAAVKTLSTYTLNVYDGVTSLTSTVRNTNSAYKLPESVDFTLGTNVYRMTDEYICSVKQQNGVDVLTQLVPVLGMKFLGASPYEAYLYSQATRRYYIYRGSTSLDGQSMLERFRDITTGRWDFINQEVVFACVATFDRLDDSVHDDPDETDNVIVPVFNNGGVTAEVAPPVTTIFNTKSWFKVYSLPSGLVFQGPNRCIINRYVYNDYMLNDIVRNKRSNSKAWKPVPREDYHPFREYTASFENVTTEVGTATPAVDGWTHNPFLLVTSPLGADESMDNMYEWTITFAWTVEMDKLYASDEYACVNVCAETMTPGGKLISRPTHVYLTKKLFTNSGNYGYYSFKYQSKNGAGNRERLHIWCDSYIAVSSLSCEIAIVTGNRTSKLTQQVDVQSLKEM